jgi:hypothetical protein
MKTNLILISLAVASVSTSAIAQDKAQHYISFSVGASAPVGDFSKSDAGTFNNWNNSAGFAKTGMLFTIEGAYYFKSRIALAGTLYFSDHGSFNGTDASKLGDSYTDAFAVDYTTVSTTGRYQSLNLLIGPQYSFPVKKITIDVRLLGGVIKSLSTPTMTVELEDQSSFTQSSSNAAAFGWQVGGGFRYPLTNKLGFLFKADYFNSSGVTVDNSNRNNTAGRLVTTQPMSWINGAVGMTLLLGR